MKTKFLVSSACFLSVLGAVLWPLSPSSAQDVQYYPEVSNEIKHDVSPPLRDIVSSTRSEALKRVIPLMLLHPSQGLLSQQPDPVLQTSAGPRVNTTAGLNFAGVGNGDYGFVPNAAPPDTNGAVGATQFVQWVNESFAVFDKTTGVIAAGFPKAGNTLWTGFGGGCETNNDGDIIAQYDKAANRWVLTQFSVSTTPYLQCVAVSTTSDATGAYNRYSFTQPNFPDYPKLGIWPDAYYMSFNMFSGNTFVGGRACAFERNSMLTGAAATQQCFQLGPGFGGLLPSDLDGATAPPAGSPNFFLNFGTNSLNLWKFHVDFANSANSTFTGPTNIPVAAFSEACGGGTCIPQLGTSQLLDSLADRVMYRFAYRNFGDHESLVINHSVTAGSAVGVRWYELRSPNGTPTVFQSGTFAPDSNYRWMGSIAMDHSGDIAVGYSESSNSINPSIYYTGRVPSDALGTMGSENLIFAGTGSQSGFNLSRWGDYSSMSVDPVDDCTFWYTNEYLKTTGAFNWSTRIASFKFPSCSASTAPDFAIGATPTSQSASQGGSTTYNVTISPLNGYTGTVSFNASGLPAGASASFTPATVTTSGSSTMTVTVGSSTTPGSYPLTVTGTDTVNSSLTHSAQVTLVVTSNSGDFTLTASPASATIVQNGSTPYTATVTPTGGFTGTVTFSVTGLPAGATGTFNPTTVTTSGPSTLTVTAGGASTPPGTYTLTIKGTSGALTHSTTVTLVVVKGTYTFAVSPSSQTVAQGSNTTYTATVTGMFSFNGVVTFSVANLPAGATGTFNPTSVTGSGSSTLTVGTVSTTTPGTYTLAVTASSPGLSFTKNVTLIVTSVQSGDFTLTASPSSATVVQIGSTAYTATVAPTGGFSGTVTFSVTGLPAGATGTFNPTTVTTSGSSTLTVTAGGASTLPGTYTLTIKGTSGTLTHSTTVTLVVVAGTYTFAVSPSSQTVTHGSSTTYTATVTGSHGFNGVVTFSVANLPSGATGTFNPTTVTGSGTSTLTVSTASTTPTGTYTLSVTASSPGLSITKNVTLIVN